MDQSIQVDVYLKVAAIGHLFMYKKQRPQTRWSDNLRRTAGKIWMRVGTEDQATLFRLNSEKL
jgi:hypothetical protein